MRTCYSTPAVAYAFAVTADSTSAAATRERVTSERAGSCAGLLCCLLLEKGARCDMPGGHRA